MKKTEKFVYRNFLVAPNTTIIKYLFGQAVQCVYIRLEDVTFAAFFYKQSKYLAKFAAIIRENM